MSAYAALHRAGAEEARTLVETEREGDRATLTPAEPQRLNALSPGLNLQLQRELEAIAHDDGIRSVVLTGRGPAFSAGGDLEMIRDGNRAIRDSSDASDTSDPWRWIRRHFGGVVRLITSTDKLFVAAINGPAAGVGLAFALACDVVIASERAVIVPAFGRLGLVPEVGTSWLLTRRLGYHGAMAYYLRGRHLSADEALALGLVQEVHEHDRLLDGASQWCERASAMPAHALEMTKSLLRTATDAPWEETLRLEEFAEANCFSTASLGAAADALLEARDGDGGAAGA